MATIRKQSKKKAPRRAGLKTSPAKTSPRSSTKEDAGGWLGHRPFAMVGYGPSGIGKTSLAAHFPDVTFVHDPQETGIEDLVEYGLAPKPHKIIEVDNFLKLLEISEKVALGKVPGTKTLVFDSLTGLEKLCFHHHCDEYFDGDWSSKGFYSYQQGPKNAAKTDWPRFLDVLEDVRTSGVNVFLIAHSTVKPYNNPEGSDWDRFVPKLERDIWDATHRWSQAVLFMNHVIDVNDKGSRKKARAGSERRNLYTEAQGAFDAKNRMGLTPVIDMGESGKEAFDNLKKAMEEVGQ